MTDITFLSSGTSKGFRRPVDRVWKEVFDNIELVCSKCWFPPFIHVDICLPMDHIFGYTLRAVCEAKGVSYTVHSDLLRAKPKGDVLVTIPRLAKLYFKRGCRPIYWISGSEASDIKTPFFTKKLDSYGASEVGVISMSTISRNKAGTVGVPIIPIKFDIYGAIWVKAEGQDWFHPGDYGHMDGKYLVLHPRGFDETMNIIL